MDIKTSNKINKEFLQDNLKKVFGFNNFRGKQEDIILNLLAGNDAMVIMPTGGENQCVINFLLFYLRELLLLFLH